MLVDLSDAELVEAARLGDRLAFGTLFDRHRGVAFSISRRVLPSLALIDDAMQEAALQAMLGLDRLRTPERFGSWFGGITMHVCRRLIRERQTHAWFSLDELDGGRAAPVALGPEATASEHESVDQLRAALSDLPSGQRAAATLVYLGGFTHAEVANLLGIRPGAVKARLHKARARLRPYLLTLMEETLTNEKEAVESRLLPARVADVRRTADGLHWVTVRELNGLRETHVPAPGPAAISLAQAIAIALQRQRLPNWLFEDVVRVRAETALVSPAALTPGRFVDGQLTGVRLTKQDDGVTALLQVAPASGSEAAESPAEIPEQPVVQSLLRSVVTGVPLHIDEQLLADAHYSANTPGSVGSSALADEVLTRWQGWRDNSPEWVEVRVADIFVVNPNTPHVRYVVMLQDLANPARFLTIWVGQSEGNGLAVLLANTEMPRPFSIVTMGRLLAAAGGQVRQIRINRLVEQTFYAELVVVGANGEQVLDARPSDALGVALHMQSPVYVSAPVLEIAATYGITLPEPSAASRICERMRETWNRPRWLRAAS
jgi:RNA polymerase sigma-70 factor (ECF subfamily)